MARNVGSAPSPTEGNGRGSNGRFLPGNRCAKGNPHAARVAKLREAALSSVSQKDMKAVLGKLLTMAREGDVAAAKELLLRVLGPPVAADVEDRLARLEELLERRLGR